MAEGNENVIGQFECDKLRLDDILEVLSRHAGHGDDGRIQQRENKLPEYRKLAIPKEEFIKHDHERCGGSLSSDSSRHWQDDHNSFDTSLCPEITRWRNQEAKTIRSGDFTEVCQPWGAVRKNPSDENILSSNVTDVVDSGTRLITNPVPIGSNFRHQPSGKKALVDDSDDEDHSDDIKGWREKPISVWNEIDTKKWLCETSIANGQLYREISPNLAMPGEELLLLTRDDWLLYDKKFGGQLYDSLCELRLRLGGSRIYLPTKEDETLDESDSPSTDEDSDKKPPKPTKKTVRSSSKNKKPKKSVPLVYLFVIDLLHNSEYCPSIIRWRNYEEKEFKFVDTQRVAELWAGFGKNKTKEYKKPMDFDTFTRAIRYHYRTGENNAKGAILFLPHEDKTVYHLGPDAVGWRTEDRDFGRYHQFQSVIKKHNLVLSRGWGN